MNIKKLTKTLLFILLNCLSAAYAMPTFSIVPQQGFSPVVQLTANSTATVKYWVTNNTRTARVLTLRPWAFVSPAAITQELGAGNCNFPSVLRPGERCSLSLSINGSQLPVTGISGGPVVCKTMGPGNNLPDPNLCSAASPGLQISLSGNNLNIASQYIAFATAFINSSIYPIQIFISPSSLPWRVRPIVSFIWNIAAKAIGGGTNIPSSANLVASSCGSAFNGASFCVLVGDNNGAPFIMQSTNGGATWINSPAPIPAQGRINNVSCTTEPSGNNACVAMGLNTSVEEPFILQTVNSGQTWSLVPNVLAGSLLNMANCTANNAHTLCQVTAFDDVYGPIIYHYESNAGWSIKFISVISDNASLNSINCTSLVNSDISCLIGISGDNSNLANLLQTVQTASNYQVHYVTNPLTRGPNIIINAISCALHTGSTVYCAAAGSNNSSPFLLQNVDINNDSGWSLVPTGSANGEFLTTSCTSLNGQIVCNAGGSIRANNLESPLFMATTDGSIWSVLDIAGIPSYGFYNASSCSVSNGAVFCTASGTNTVAQEPFSVGSPNLASSSGLTLNGAAKQPYKSGPGILNIFKLAVP